MARKVFVRELCHQNKYGGMLSGHFKLEFVQKSIKMSPGVAFPLFHVKIFFVFKHEVGWSQMDLYPILLFRFPHPNVTNRSIKVAGPLQIIENDQLRIHITSVF